MVKILDNKTLNGDNFRVHNYKKKQFFYTSSVFFLDIPALSEKLKDMSAKQASLKVNQVEFKDDLKNFLTIYSTSVSVFSTAFWLPI